MNFPKEIIGFQATFKRIPHPHKNKPNRAILTLNNELGKIATVRWDHNKKYVWVIEISIKREFQRQGIGTAIYDELQVITGKPIKWEPKLMSPKMKCFVKKYIMNCKSMIASKF